MGSIASNFMMLGMYFYMHARFGWGAKENLILSTVQGALYIAGALLASPISQRIGRRKMMAALNILLAGSAIFGLFATSSAQIAAILLAYSFLVSINWPALESLVSAGADSHSMSRRIGIYNLTWAGTGALTIAICGTVIVKWRAGVFVIPALAHFCMAALMFIREVDPVGTGPHVAPEPELIPMRTLAMRLSRVALPATYAAIYALGALMPTLPAITAFSIEYRTLLASLWMITRFLTFIFLGATIWWHTRPRIMWLASLILPLAFLGSTIAVSEFSNIPASADAWFLIGWQILFGISVGLIYSGSLYFGMVLSDGSTEHGGYHEALIGLGSVLGPGSGAVILLLDPAQPQLGIACVAVVLGASAALSSIFAMSEKSS
jgi:MFS family permease